MFMNRQVHPYIPVHLHTTHTTHTQTGGYAERQIKMAEVIVQEISWQLGLSGSRFRILTHVVSPAERTEETFVALLGTAVVPCLCLFSGPWY